MKCEMCTVYCELLAVNWKLETGDYHGQRTQDEGVGPSVGVESKRALGAEIAGIHARGAKRGRGKLFKRTTRQYFGIFCKSICHIKGGYLL